MRGTRSVVGFTLTEECGERDACVVIVTFVRPTYMGLKRLVVLLCLTDNNLDFDCHELSSDVK